MIKFNPSLMPTGEFNMGVEQSILRNLSIEASGGFVFTDYWEGIARDAGWGSNDGRRPLIESERYDRGQGWTARAAVKYYVRNLNNKGAAQGLYLAMQFMLKQVYYPNSTDMQTGSDLVDVSKTVYGGQVLFGFQPVMGKFVIDPYVGFGLRYKDFAANRINNLPYGYTYGEPGGYVMPSFQLGVKIGVSFQ
jgi:hypothetical protein